MTDELGMSEKDYQEKKEWQELLSSFNNPIMWLVSFCQPLIVFFSIVFSFGNFFLLFWVTYSYTNP